MSNLLKSKLFLGAMVVALALVAVSSASAAYVHTTLLKMGMSNSQVMSLQQTLNANGFLVSTTGAGSPGAESMYFGTKTKAAVMAFQSAKGLTVDGIVGAQSGAALAAMGGTSMSYPAGCTSASGFSTTTGMPCNTGGTSLPAGCTSTVGFSPTTGMSCSGGTSTGALSGGAGNATISATSVDTESEVSEGTTEKVAGLKVEASGSDISVSNVQVTLTNLGSGSTWLSRYASEVSVWMGNTKVGSLPVSSFSQSGTDYTGNIAVSNAVIREGAANRQYMYVGFTANNTIDSTDASGNLWRVVVDNVRYSDATGVVLTVNTNLSTTGIQFQNLASSGDVKVTVTRDTSSPAAGNVEVSDTGSTSDVALLALRVKAEGTDVSVDSLKFVLTSVGATPTEIASLITVYDGSQRLGELSSLGASAASNTVNLDSTLVIPKGSTKVLTLKAKINKIAVGNFGQGDSLKADLGSTTGLFLGSTGSAITTISGSAIGEVLAFYSEGINASGFTSSVATTTNTSGVTTKQTYTASFNLTAFGNTYYIPKGVTKVATLPNDSTNGLSYSVESSAGVATSYDNVAVTSSASAMTSNASVVSNYYEIPDGQTKTFSVVIEITPGSTPVSGFYHIQLGSVLYDLNQTAVGTDEAVYTFAPAQDFETADRSI